MAGVSFSILGTLGRIYRGCLGFFPLAQFCFCNNTFCFCCALPAPCWASLPLPKHWLCPTPGLLFIPFYSHNPGNFFLCIWCIFLALRNLRVCGLGFCPWGPSTQPPPFSRLDGHLFPPGREWYVPFGRLDGGEFFWEKTMRNTQSSSKILGLRQLTWPTSPSAPISFLAHPPLIDTIAVSRLPSI